MPERQRPRTQEERIREREEAVARQQAKLTEGLEGVRKKLPDAFFQPEERPHPKTNKVFMGIGIFLGALIMIGVIQAIVSAFSSDKKEQTKAPIVQKAETADEDEK